MDDLVGGRWRGVDAGAEVRHQQELADAVLRGIERHHEARQLRGLAVERDVDRRVVPDGTHLVEHLDRARVVVAQRFEADVAVALGRVPVLGHQRVPGQLLGGGRAGGALPRCGVGTAGGQQAARDSHQQHHSDTYHAANKKAHDPDCACRTNPALGACRKTRTESNGTFHMVAAPTRT
ncbi:hypothetical protein D9M68_761580 [compost metagenome]